MKGTHVKDAMPHQFLELGGNVESALALFSVHTVTMVTSILYDISSIGWQLQRPGGECYINGHDCGMMSYHTRSEKVRWYFKHIVSRDIFVGTNFRGFLYPRKLYTQKFVYNE